MGRTAKSEDFNSAPVAAHGPAADSSTRPLVVWLAGGEWDAIPGTDRRMVGALGEVADVLWVDPPSSWVSERRGLRRERPSVLLNAVAGVDVLRVKVVPGFTRPVLRRISRSLVGRAVRREIRRGVRMVSATIVASPQSEFVRGIPGTRGYYVTDDWVAGSRLMGLSSSHIVRLQDTNLLAADEVLAVSPDLATVVARRLEALDRSGPVTVLPNGCYPARLANASEKCDDVAGLVGKLNERLDLSLLEAVVAAGIRLRIIGPRRDRDPDFGVRLSALLSNDKVEWLGEVGSDELPDLLGGIKVGLTPYDTGPFNRSSFPLKTLEYLAAGLPVVSTPIPAVGWLNTDMIVTATLPAEFAQRTLELIESPIDHDQVTARIAFARQHSWTCRAQSLMNTLGIVDGGDRTKVVS